MTQDTPVLKENHQIWITDELWQEVRAICYKQNIKPSEAISELIATKQTEARIDEVEKINKHGQTVGAIGYRHYLEGRIAELRNTKVENPNLATSKSQHTNPSGTLSMPQPEVEK